MFVEGGWTPPGEPPRRPRLSGREERVLIWILAGLAFLSLIAPIGNASLIQAVIAVFRRG